jgi:uncharacterized repeat protein (TIGR03803 family)
MAGGPLKPDFGLSGDLEDEFSRRKRAGGQIFESHTTKIALPGPPAHRSYPQIVSARPYTFFRIDIPCPRKHNDCLLVGTGAPVSFANRSLGIPTRGRSMRRNQYWAGGVGILALLGLVPVISSGASQSSKAKPQGAHEKVIYSFTGGADGAHPMSDLVIDRAGNLYGTTSEGGSTTSCFFGCGTVFQLKHTQTGWEEQVLYRFGNDTNDGQSPEAGMIFDSSGNLYGTTREGGTGREGTVFKLAPNGKGGWAESVIYSFPGYPHVALPSSDLVQDAYGNLYGSTPYGGSGGGDGFGTVFELIRRSDGSWTESTLYQFAGPPGDGANPSSGVVLDSAGNLYGLTAGGGSNPCNGFNPGCGIAYKLTPDGKGNWKETVLFNFARGSGFPANPSGGLLVDPDGDRLVGTTVRGGNGLGTVFVLNQSKQGEWKQDVVHRFYENLDGRSPLGQLTRNSHGNLLGTTVAGGRQYSGMVFELEAREKGAWKEKILYGFGGGGDAQYPEAGLVLDNRGHLYGTTFGGAQARCARTARAAERSTRLLLNGVEWRSTI